MLVEGHDVEKTGISVDEMVSKKGKDFGYSRYTPLQMAVEKEELEIANTSSRLVLWTSLEVPRAIVRIVYI